MPSISPNKIYQDFKSRILSKINASKLLFSIIDNAKDHDYKTQILCIKFIGLIGSKEESMFSFLENLLISDLNEEIRGNAARVIIENFPEKAKKPISWALKNEKSIFCKVLIIKALEKKSTRKLKSLLKIKKYVKFEENLYFPSGFHQIINLNGKNIEKITDIEGLESLTNLEKLYLNFNQLKVIKGLKNLNNLRSLHLQGNRISKISGLEDLKKLEYLYLNNNEISKINGVSVVPNLKTLQLFDNQISEITGLEGLPNIEVLNLRNNQINEIKGLNRLFNLKRLDLSNNRITEIKGLETLTKLEFLDLSHNQITEIKELQSLKKLKFLDLRNNQIKQINGLKDLKKLQQLYVGFNNLEEKSSLEILKHIKILDIKNTEDDFIPDSLWEVYNKNETDEESLEEKLRGFRDIKYLSPSFKSNNLLYVLKPIEHPLDYFTDSSWIITWKNNQFESFRLSKLGKITWLRKNRNRK